MLVALVMICGAVPLTARAEEWPPANAAPIKMNDFTKVDITAADEPGYFSVKPSRTELHYFGFAALCETPHTEGPLHVEYSLHAADGEKLWPTDAEYDVDRLEIQLTAKQVYYLKVRMNHPDAAGKISVFARSQTDIDQQPKTPLDATIVEAKAAPRLWVPAIKWLALQKAITAAQAVADDPKATEEQRSAQNGTLKQAISAAKPVDGCGFIYRPGDFIKLHQSQWDGYSDIAQVLYIIQLPFALIWVPVHFLLIGISWVIGWFI